MALDKAVDSAKLNADLTSIADSVRAKGGTTEKFRSAAEMKSAVDAIPTGTDTSKDTVTPETLMEGATAHNKAGERIVGVVLNLAGDTVTPETLLEGTTAHDKTGAAIVGTAKAGNARTVAFWTGPIHANHGKTYARDSQGNKLAEFVGLICVDVPADGVLIVETWGTQATAFFDNQQEVSLPSVEPFIPDNAKPKTFVCEIPEGRNVLIYST